MKRYKVCVGDLYRIQDKLRKFPGSIRTYPEDATGLRSVDIEAHLEASDWVYCARLSHAGNKIVVDSIGEEYLPPRFLEAGKNCDRCKVKHNRKYTFVLRGKESNEYLQLGSSCVRTHLNGNPDKVGECINTIKDVESDLEEAQERAARGEGEEIIPGDAIVIDEFIGKCITTLKRYGWSDDHKRKLANIAWGITPSHDGVEALLWGQSLNHVGVKNTFVTENGDARVVVLEFALAYLLSTGEEVSDTVNSFPSEYEDVRNISYQDHDGGIMILEGEFDDGIKRRFAVDGEGYAFVGTWKKASFQWCGDVHTYDGVDIPLVSSRDLPMTPFLGRVGEVIRSTKVRKTDGRWIARNCEFSPDSESWGSLYDGAIVSMKITEHVWVIPPFVRVKILDFEDVWLGDVGEVVEANVFSYTIRNKGDGHVLWFKTVEGSAIRVPLKYGDMYYGDPSKLFHLSFSVLKKLKSSNGRPFVEAEVIHNPNVSIDWLVDNGMLKEWNVKGRVHSYDVEVVRDTWKALNVKINRRQIWLPKSQIVWHREDEVVLTEWIARKKGLL